MTSRQHPRMVKDSLAQNLALACLLLLTGFALVGPSGVLAWNESLHMLDQRESEIAQLERDRARLENRVHLLNPRGADPDLAGELLRRDLNVAHPDEMVMLLR